MTTKERINELFNKFNVNLMATNLEIQAVLDNGTTIYSDASAWEEGADVYILNDEGEKIPLPEGDYELADGSVLTIVEGGRVGRAPAAVGETDSAEGEGGSVATPSNAPKGGKKPTPPAKPPAKKTKKSAQEKLAVVDVVEEEDKDGEKKEEVEVEAMDETAIRALVNSILDERFPDGAVAEEVVEEEQLADQAVSELTAQLKSQQDELSTLKSQAASEGVKRVTPTKAQPKVDLKTLSTEDRIKALFNKFNQ